MRIPACCSLSGAAILLAACAAPVVSPLEPAIKGSPLTRHAEVDWFTEENLDYGLEQALAQMVCDVQREFLQFRSGVDVSIEVRGTPIEFGAKATFDFQVGSGHEGYLESLRFAISGDQVQIERLEWHGPSVRSDELKR